MLRFDRSFLVSSSSSILNSTDIKDYCNVDPNDPNVLYPPYYIPPPGFVPRSPSSSVSSEVDYESVTVNGMPSNFRS